MRTKYRRILSKCTKFSVIAAYLIWFNANMPHGSLTKEAIMENTDYITSINQPVHHHQQNRDIDWYNSTRIKGVDYYAAAWLMPVGTFLETKAEGIRSLEGAVLQVFFQHTQKIRQPLDWLDFAVEHMSKWWKMTEVVEPTQNTVAFDKINKAFLDYIGSSPSLPWYHSSSPVNAAQEECPTRPHWLNETIAFVTFYASIETGSPVKLERSTRLTITSLAATVSSLERVGFGRIIVVGTKDSDEDLVRDAFRLVQKGDGNCGGIEYGFAKLKKENWFKTKDSPVNVPKSAIIRLQQVMKGNVTQKEAQAWLGKGEKRWKYVYYTEADQILQTRPRSLKAIRDALDQGLVLMPQRLNPIPHFIDLKGSSSRNLLKPLGSFMDKPVIELDGQNDGCCDLAVHPKDDFEHCGNFWYMCGFKCRSNNVTEHEEGHKRLLKYEFMRIKSPGGTGIVFAGSEHGRTCRPMKGKDYICQPPEISD